MAAEQQTIPGSIVIEPDRRCEWDLIEYLICGTETGLGCRLIADPGSAYCQKHTMILGTKGIDIDDPK